MVSLYTLFLDVRYALRQLIHSPVFSVTAIFTLALGLGATTAVFSVCQAILLRSLPYRNPDRLVVIWQSDASHRDTGQFFNAYREFDAWKQGSRSFEQMAPLSWAARGQTALWQERPIDLLAIPAGADFFRLLGVSAQMGRTFSASDLDHPCTLVLAHKFWENKLGSPAGIIGQSLRVDDTTCRIAGVMPNSFTFYPVETDAWSLITPTSEYGRQPWTSMTAVFGLLKPGVTRSSAAQELTGIQQQVLPEAPARLDILHNTTPVVLPLQSNFVWLTGRNLHKALWIMLGAVSLILLIGCSNLATLSLGRLGRRAQEMAIRSALGASRARLIRQMLVESLLLALGGTFAGCVLAEVLLRWLRASTAIELPPGNVVGLDWRVLLFATALGIGSVVIFGVLPAGYGSKSDLTLKSRGQESTRLYRHLTSGFIVFQVALSVTLLMAASLLGKSLWELVSTQLGYRTFSLLSAEIHLSAKSYPDQDVRRRFAQRFAQEMDGMPGRPGFTLSAEVVPRGTEPLTVSGQVAAEKTAEGVATQAVADNFFSLMNIPLMRGRSFASGDRKDTQSVAIVNQALVKRYFPGGDAVGRQIKLSRADDPLTPWLTVVGVVANVRTSTVFQEMGYVEAPAVYRPLSQESPESLTVLVAVTPGTQANLIAGMQRQLSALGPGLVLSNMQTVEQLQARNLTQPRFRALLLGSFALLALLLASIGLYGVLAQLVSQKTREIGIRMALGADRMEILSSVLKHAAALLGAGILAGVAGAALTGMLLRGLLYGAGAEDPAVLVSAVMIMLVVGLSAALQPALRASLLDPAIVLRSE